MQTFAKSRDPYQTAVDLGLLCLLGPSCPKTLNEPRSEKTGHLGFRPGPTQIRLYSHRRWLDA